MKRTQSQCAVEAVRMVLPVAMVLMKDLGKFGFHIVVANPTVKVGEGMSVEDWRNADGILHQQSAGDRATWHKTYDTIALSKTHLSAREGMSTRDIQTYRSYLLAEGDTTYFGSAHEHGVTVGVSGLPPHFDEMIAKMVLAAFRALWEDGSADRAVDDNGFLLKAS